MGKFIISKRTNDDYQFNLKAANGQVILTSQGYNSKASCENGIESVKKNAPDDARFERLTAKDGRWYFNLKAGNGQVIGTSQMYESDNGMEKGIDSVKNNAPNASVENDTNN
ncbi:MULTISPECIES: YegP family protein [unclassified Chryseobacterium]|uniref:YegP family protein n=1 Tax=unclassified Chryseobacterium TaxID=2593645 RepID=UPI00226AC429|nr:MULTISPECIES: YegP family protein [unclassified Chryseobacterium]